MLRNVAMVVGLAGCAETIPHAIVQPAPGSIKPGGAVLILPTRCTTELSPELCVPQTYEVSTAGLRPPMPPTYAPLIDPSLRLELEFAGYTLAEAATMQLTTRDRIDTHVSTSGNDHQVASGSSSEVEPVLTVADLPEPEMFDVARSLHLAGVIASTLRVSDGPYGGKWFQLTVSLHEVGRREATWSVTCTEPFFDNIASSKRLGNCVGNGVLAAFAPDNLMGKPL